MRFSLLVALLTTWALAVTCRPTDTYDLPPQLQPRGFTSCLFPLFNPAPRHFTVNFNTDPIGYTRSRLGDGPWARAGNTLLNWRQFEDLRGISYLNSVLEVAPPNGHGALHNYEIEIRRTPISNPNAASECFRTTRLNVGQTSARIQWNLDAGYTYHLTISED
ncbi:uncharacterized protein RCO7_05358 [Rhynchosporium graminicola]|uniref:Secreted in xylem 7 n=1 Tax=Rhynchosporium graminicola TaxID=2792576 RepID=A0A1E1L465_9HELO|nr:uncharacterized protein RCO7_05358 [Rhynchosporium commune]